MLFKALNVRKVLLVPFQRQYKNAREENSSEKSIFNQKRAVFWSGSFYAIFHWVDKNTFFEAHKSAFCQKLSTFGPARRRQNAKVSAAENSPEYSKQIEKFLFTSLPPFCSQSSCISIRLFRFFKNTFTTAKLNVQQYVSRLWVIKKKARKVDNNPRQKKNARKEKCKNDRFELWGNYSKV